MSNPVPREPDRQSLREEVARRVRMVRIDLYGEHGGPLLADALNLSTRSWIGYEQGAAIPGEVMLRFLLHTRTDPHWLITGEGGRYVDEDAPPTAGPGPRPGD